jgi:hypothetical protein
MGVPDDELTTTVSEPHRAGPLQIYPVPAQDQVFVALHGARGAVAIDVLDASGRVVIRSALGAPLGTIDVHALAPGCYHLHATDRWGVQAVQRFVVQR